MPVEEVLRRSTIWKNVKRLYLRGAINIEIADITGFSYDQVKNAVNNSSKRVDWNRAPREFFTPQVISERKRKAMVRRTKISQSELDAKNERRTIEFARILLNEGLITEDCSDWEMMKELYAKSRRSLPESFAERLRLEFFHKAVSQKRGGDISLLILYKNLGEKVDSDWFEVSLADEEDFISTFVENDLIGLFRQDGMGLYRTDEDGNRWRQPVRVGENGGIIFDSIEELKFRTTLRSRKPQ